MDVYFLEIHKLHTIFAKEKDWFLIQFHYEKYHLSSILCNICNSFFAQRLCSAQA